MHTSISNSIKWQNERLSLSNQISMYPKSNKPIDQNVIITIKATISFIQFGDMNISFANE